MQRFFRKIYRQLGKETQRKISNSLEGLPDPDDLDEDYVLVYFAKHAPRTQKLHLGWWKALLKFLERADELEDVKVQRSKPAITVKDLYTRLTKWSHCSRFSSTI